MKSLHKIDLASLEELKMLIGDDDPDPFLLKDLIVLLGLVIKLKPVLGS